MGLFPSPSKSVLPVSTKRLGLLGALYLSLCRSIICCDPGPSLAYHNKQQPVPSSLSSLPDGSSLAAMHMQTWELLYMSSLTPMPCALFTGRCTEIDSGYVCSLMLLRMPDICPAVPRTRWDLLIPQKGHFLFQPCWCSDTNPLCPLICLLKAAAIVEYTECYLPLHCKCFFLGLCIIYPRVDAVLNAWSIVFNKLSRLWLFIVMSEKSFSC